MNPSPSLGRHGTHFLNTSTEDIEGPAGTLKESAGATLQEHPPEVVAKPLSILQNPQPGQGSDYNGALMSFYDLVICSTATIEDTPESNPFRGVLIPLALQSNAVLHALQAVSAKVISLRQPSYQETTLSYHSTALRGLITTIDDLGKSGTSLLEACAASTLLCWFEISRNNRRTWVNHLTGLMHLLARREKAVPLPPFLVDWFLFHFVVDRTVLDIAHLERAMKTYTEQHTNTDASTSPYDVAQDDDKDHSALETNLDSFMSSGHLSEMTVTLLQWMGSVNLHQINTYTGLSGCLLLLINQITDLECPSNSREATVHHRIAAGIKTLLEQLHQDVPPNLLQIEKDRRFWNVAPVRMMIVKIWRHRDLRVAEPMISIRKYKKPPRKNTGSIEGSASDWDRILEMMANFTWSLT
ncbi:hypothetical protein PRZ48_006927 [Zasmidium cellare]|uniref:Uncharacterized protein n=1 Tax=Zasmidium cellare TaxID=395010 RepID=A0ABR0EHY1_ZASCE|nr:hypothetical protein PRZ48_006927 [Zasmidium cellare]